MNRLVVRFNDGHLLKGMTVDFSATTDTFHVIRSITEDDWDPAEVHIEDLKALFFVKSFDGDPSHEDQMWRRPKPAVDERAVEVTFNDEERLVGTTTGHGRASTGFYVRPVDPESNNLLAYVFDSATKDVRFV